MWKFRVSSVLPFWTRQNENKPSKTIFEKWKNENLQEVDTISINFITFNNISINTYFNGYKYIEITNTDDPNDVRYYFVNNINQTGSTNSYKYNGVIDAYCSYVIDFIEDNKSNEFIFLRTHTYDKTCLQLEDSNIAQIPKIYKNFYFQKKQFNNVDGTNVWYGENIGISGTDLVNGNKYYVFQDGVNGGYKFFPVLSKTNKVTIYYSKPTKGKLLSTKYFWNGRKNNTLKQEIGADVNEAVVNAYNNGDIVEYQYRQVGQGYKFPAETVWFNGWTNIPNVPYGTKPIDIRLESWYGNTAGAGLRGINYTVYVLGNQVYSKSSKNLTSSAFDEMDYVTDQGRQFRVNIYKGEPTTTQVSCNNSQTGLEIYRKQQNNINKFLGIFYLPHFLNFDKFDTEGDYVFVNIDPQGDNITLFPIFDYSMSNITDKLNNPSYSTPYFLRYLNIKYYGNLINAEYRTNENSQIYIGGKLFFTDTANIISKSDDLIDLNRSIVGYPYQLPIGVDTYEKYVQANRNATDTSFNIAKQQQDMNIAKTLFGGAMGAVKAGAQIASGNIVGGAMSAVNAVSDTVFGMISQDQQMEQMQKRIRAQYEQANMTMGNQMQFSTIQAAALTEYYDSNDGTQFEGVEVSDLAESSLIQLNNYIFLNGYLNPQKDTLMNRIVNDRPFNYIQLDAQILISTLNINWNNNKYNNEMFQLITSILTNGVRIWNIESINNLPEWDNDEEWPNQPDRNEIQPPKPPIISETIIIPNETNDKLYCPYIASWEFNHSYGFVVIFDNNSISIFGQNKGKITVPLQNPVNTLSEITIDLTQWTSIYNPASGSVTPDNTFLIYAKQLDAITPTPDKDNELPIKFTIKCKNSISYDLKNRTYIKYDLGENDNGNPAPDFFNEVQLDIVS